MTALLERVPLLGWIGIVLVVYLLGYGWFEVRRERRRNARLGDHTDREFD